MKCIGLVVAALAAASQALVILTNENYIVEAGKAFTLTWADAVGPVTITLKNGPKGDLKTVASIGAVCSGVSGTSCTWTPPASLPTDTYAFEIKDSKDTNFSPQFSFVGSASTSSSTSTSASTTSSSSSSSTSGSTSSTNSSSTSTGSTTSTSTSTSATTSNTVRPTINSNHGPSHQSPLAFVLVTVATFIYLN